jgi:hypothetical protein
VAPGRSTARGKQRDGSDNPHNPLTAHDSIVRSPAQTFKQR